MKSLYLLSVSFFCLSIIFNNTIIAQEKECKENLHTFNIYFINGYGISYDFYKTGKSTFKLYLDFGSMGFDSDGNEERKEGNSNSENEYKSDLDDSYSLFDITILPQFIFDIYQSKYGSFYIGGGPFFNYRKDKNDSKAAITPDVNNTMTMHDFSSGYNESKLYKLGLTLIIGFKGRLSDHVYIFAESHFSGSKYWNEINTKQQYIYDEDDYGYNYERSSDSDGWRHDVTFLKAGISVSF